MDSYHGFVDGGHRGGGGGRDNATGESPPDAQSLLPTKESFMYWRTTSRAMAGLI